MKAFLKLPGQQFLLLQLICFLIFLGRAYQHIFWDAPYRSILWDEELMVPILKSVFNIEWSAFAEDVSVDYKIQLWIKGIGVLLLNAAIASLLIKRFVKYARVSIIIGWAILFVLAIASFKSKFFQIGEWFEFGVQLAAPIVLLMIQKRGTLTPAIVLVTKIGIAITFIGHGLYAFGLYPQPGNYVDMIILILGVTESTARGMLTAAGTLDFIVAIYIFIPSSTAKYALIYCTIWGLLTAFARVVAGFNADFALQTLHQWGFETVYRLPHGLLPLWLLLGLFYAQAKSKSNLT